MQIRRQIAHELVHAKVALCAFSIEKPALLNTSSNCLQQCGNLDPSASDPFAGICMTRSSFLKLTATIGTGESFSVVDSVQKAFNRLILCN
jgi:hypothetical protein